MKHKPSKQTWQEFEIGVIGLICMALFLFMWNSWTNLGKNNVGHLTKAYSMEIPEPLTFNPDLPEIEIAFQGKVDMDKLAKAVAIAETGGCKDGTAVKRKNCHGIMTWDKNGVRSPRYFKSHAESYAAFKDIWSRKYGGRFPTYADAKLWTGGDQTDTWLNNVKYAYNR